MICSKNGFRKSTDPSFVRKVNKLKTRTCCLAMIEFTVENGSWVVSQFFSDHNHELGKKNQ